MTVQQTGSMEPGAHQSIHGTRDTAEDRTAWAEPARSGPPPSPQPQAEPLTVKLVGEASLPAQVPWKPKDVEPAAGIAAL